MNGEIHDMRGLIIMQRMAKQKYDIMWVSDQNYSLRPIAHVVYMIIWYRRDIIVYIYVYTSYVFSSQIKYNVINNKTAPK